MSDPIPPSSIQTIPKNTAELGRLLDAKKPYHTRIGQFLLKENLISAETLKKATQLQVVSPNKKLGEILVEMGALTPAQTQMAVMSSLDLPMVQLGEFDFDQLAVGHIPAEQLQKYHFIPLMFHNHMLVLAIHTLPDSETLELLRFMAERPIQLVLATKEDIESALQQHCNTLDSARELANPDLEIAAPPEEQQLWQEAEQLAKQAPLVKLVNSILRDSIRQRASDIHIRPGEKHVEVLFRVDGTLIPILELQKSLLPAVVSRIKILCGLNIAERRQPQDGRLRFQESNLSVDMRISMIPVRYGESVVIRVLDKSRGMRSVAEIGFSGQDLARFLDLLKRSHGIILITGPTGSGKSTTLYAALQEFLKGPVNVITVEDPIEYELAKARQIQIQPMLDFGFPEALRHILRHDPDVIMIGEMRDHETCKIAVESALTGHLVLSTLHTNDAPSTLVRLIEIGIAPYMIRSAVIGVLAQRLVRRNCSHCLVEETVDPLMRANLGLPAKGKYFRGAGCDHCHHTGFSGRMAIYELLVMDDALRDRIAAGVGSSEYRGLAIKAGMVPLASNGVVHAQSGKVSIAEIYQTCM